MTDTTISDKCFESLSTKTKNALRRNRGKDGFRGHDSGIATYRALMPWSLSVSELLQIRGIGPAAIKEIAAAVEKHCV